MTARGGHLLPPHINGTKKPYNEKLEGIEARGKPRRSDRKDTKIIKQD